METRLRACALAYKSRRDDLIKPGVQPPVRNASIVSSPGGATAIEFSSNSVAPLGFSDSSTKIRDFRPRLYSVAAPRLLFAADAGGS